MATYLEQLREDVAREMAKPIPVRFCVLLAVWQRQQEHGDVTVRFGDLVVAAWKRAPASLSLEGHPDIPDASRVLKYLCGDEGLVAIGMLRRVADRRYQLTARGRRRAEQLARRLSP